MTPVFTKGVINGVVATFIPQFYFTPTLTPYSKSRIFSISDIMPKIHQPYRKETEMCLKNVANFISVVLNPQNQNVLVQNPSKIDTVTSWELIDIVTNMERGEAIQVYLRSCDPIFKSEGTVSLFIASLSYIKGRTTYCNWQKMEEGVLFEVRID